MRPLRMMGSWFFAIAAIGNVHYGDPIGLVACLLLSVGLWPPARTIGAGDGTRRDGMGGRDER